MDDSQAVGPAAGGGGLRDHGEAIEVRQWWAVGDGGACSSLPGYCSNHPPCPAERWPAPARRRLQVLALPVASIEAFIQDDAVGKSAGLLFSLMWLQVRAGARWRQG